MARQDPYRDRDGLTPEEPCKGKRPGTGRPFPWLSTEIKVFHVCPSGLAKTVKRRIMPGKVSEMSQC